MKKLLLFSLIAAAAFAPALPARAQSPVTPKTYALTNSTTFTIANGATNLAGSATAIINSAAFPIWRGRGFVVHSSFWGTNAGTDNLTLTFQTTTPYTIASKSYTNWSTAGTFTAVVAQNGTAVVYGSSLIPSTTADNEQLCRLYSAGNAHASSLWLDPTNTFITVIP